MSEERTRLVAGCMTGTSLDGLDVALVKIIGTGLEMRAELLGHHALSMPDDLRTALMSLASGEANEPITYMRAARALGELHAEGLEQLLAGGLVPPLDQPLDFITAHGQTIWHAPRDLQEELGGGPKSWQLFDPWPIVRRLSVPVCYDLRQADLIAGGEGAPLTPIADWSKYKDYFGWVVNLGGIMNMTCVVRESIKSIWAGDVYPCNLLLDGLAVRLFGERYDRDGEHAMQGEVQEEIVNLIRSTIGSVMGDGSLGREQFDSPWLDALCQQLAHIDTKQDVLRSACRVIATGLWDVVTSGPETERSMIVLAGGGARNLALRTELEIVCDEKPFISDDFDIPCEAREAMAFAILGALSQDGIPISLPQVTGATDPGVAGVWAGL